MKEQHDFSEVLEVASIAGHILLENGAEISRVEDIMARISTYFGVDKGNFFVLSNGIFTTGSAGKVEKAGGQASTYANVEFIPIRPIQLQKVVEVNQLSYDISAGKCSLEEARIRLDKIRNTPAKPMWEQTLGSAFGAAGFCAVFGGGWLDCGAAFVVGCLLNLFIFLVSGLWHGAATHFVLWGGIHGLGMIASKLISPVSKKVPKFFRWLFTFTFVSFAWVFFRADDTKTATDMFAQLFTVGFTPLNAELIAACIPTECQLLQWLILKVAPGFTYYSGCIIWIALVALGLYLSSFAKTVKQRCDAFAASRKKIAVTVILFTWSVLSLSEVAEFIYVNF